MSSIIQTLRRVGGAAGSPSAVGRLEGQLALNFPGAAGTNGMPVLWAYDGAGWRRVNPDIVPLAINVPQPAGGWGADVATDFNVMTAAVTVAGDQLPIVSWNGQSYMFTGGSGKWGTGSGANTGTAVTATQFIPVGSAAVDPPEVVDWSKRTEADLGAAYTAWHGGTGTPDFAGGVITLVKWKDGATYLLTAPTAPAVAGSYTALVPNVPAAVAFRAALDVTVALADVLPFAKWNSGDFAIVGKSGTVEKTDNAGGKDWGDYLTGAGTTVKQGDLLIYDGSVFHVIAMETDLSAYLKLAGDTMADGGTITFDTTTAQKATSAGGLGGAAKLTIIDGDGGTVDNVVINAGTY